MYDKTVNTLQLAKTDEEFSKAARLWFDKWNANSDTATFAAYFNDEYLTKFVGWHEGKAPGAPSTNNSLESTNCAIKREWTFRNRLSIRDFLNVAFDQIHNWSFSRSPECVNQKKFAANPTYTLKLQTSAYQWATSDKQVLTRTKTGRTNYYIQPVGGAHITSADIVQFDRQRRTLSWRTFETYTASQHKLLLVEMPTGDWEASTCSCSNFQKEYICEHTLGLAVKLKLFHVTPEAKNVPIGEKRKRGRPALAKRALLTQ